MTEIVQQRGGDEGGVGVRLLGQLRRLQRMFELRHRLAAVSAAALFSEQALDIVERE